MREIKKKIIIGYCIAMAVAGIYVPWKIDYRSRQYSTTIDGGYSFFFSPPVPEARIDYGKVVLEFVVISAVAGGVLYAVSDKLKSK